MHGSVTQGGLAIKSRRERTAIRRVACSRPIAIALADGLINTATSVFDYGCGHGSDVRYLRSCSIKAGGWDPYYQPKADLEQADVVNLGYVLNVIENPTERQEILQHAYGLAKKVLVVAVRVERVLADASVFEDGVVTKRGTFQKIYTQDEFRNFLETVLECHLQMASLGIAYVFKDQETESQYLASRAFTRRLEYRTDLIEEFSKSKLARRFVAQATRLGRLPLPEEFPKFDRLLDVFGSSQRIARLALRLIDYEAFSGLTSSTTRRHFDLFGNGATPGTQTPLLFQTTADGPS